MTAEIAILNKHGVALAADSAVTLSKPGAPKIYNTANKLFMLSKYHPVGIMVYGTADFMGIPWETVIKIYRQDLHTTNFNTLLEFANSFTSFVENNRSLFPDRRQEEALIAMCHLVLSEIKLKIDQAVKTEIDKTGAIDDNGVTQIATAVIDQAAEEWEKRYQRLDCFPEGFEEEVITRHRQTLIGLLNTIFGELPISHRHEQLLLICARRVTKDWWNSGWGGIVIAGFGKKDTFPVARCYSVEHIVNNRLKRKFLENLSHDVNETAGSSIIPFAQAEMVDRFMRGIDPEYKKQFSSFIRNLLTQEYPTRLLEQFASRLSDAERRDTQAELIRLARSILSDFESHWGEWEQEKFISPVVDIVAELPKEDLAEMAESLVNLTSFKRKISAEAETVGGPIDVAVISKGDGFVWIKRKHYFDKELNPAFFANYYRRHDE